MWVMASFPALTERQNWRAPLNNHIGYMCKTDFDHELSNVETYVYPSVDELMANRQCVAECGIVEVEVRLLRIVQPSKSPTDG